MSFRLDGFSRIRAELPFAAKVGVLNDVISGQAAVFGRGNKLRFEFLVTYKDEPADCTQLTNARLRILSSDDPDSALAMSKTIGPANIHGDITLEQWQAGESQHAHLIFEFDATETAEGLFTATLADTATDHWFIIDFDTGSSLVYAGTVKSQDVGNNPAAGTPPTNGTGATLEQIRAEFAAALTNVVRFNGNPAGATIELVAPTTGLKIKLGADDEGNLLTPTQAST